MVPLGARNSVEETMPRKLRVAVLVANTNVEEPLMTVPSAYWIAPVGPAAIAVAPVTVPQLTFPSGPVWSAFAPTLQLVVPEIVRFVDVALCAYTLKIESVDVAEVPVACVKVSVFHNWLVPVTFKVCAESVPVNTGLFVIEIDPVADPQMMLPMPEIEELTT